MESTSRMGSDSLRIRWLERYKNCYVLGGLDRIECDSILCAGLTVVPVGGNKDGKVKYDIVSASVTEVESALEDVKRATASQRPVSSDGNLKLYFREGEGVGVVSSILR